MNGTIVRRLERLERDLVPERAGPCFIMAADRDEADRRIAQLQAEHEARLPRTMFVMICPGAEQ